MLCFYIVSHLSPNCSLNFCVRCPWIGGSIKLLHGFRCQFSLPDWISNILLPVDYKQLIKDGKEGRTYLQAISPCNFSSIALLLYFRFIFFS
jgi:hypothetical protein